MKNDVYAFDENLILPGDIMCVSARSWNPFSDGIQRLTKSNLNHVAIINREASGLVVYEAAISEGFTRTPFKFYTDGLKNKKHDLCILRVRKPTELSVISYDIFIQKAIRKSISWLGKKYDISAIVGFTYICWVKIIGRAAKFKANWLQNKEKLFCSEAVCRAFHNPGFDTSIFIGEHDKSATCSTISPGDIRRSKNVEFVTGKEAMQ